MGRRRKKKGNRSHEPKPKAAPLTGEMISKIESLAQEAADANELVLYDVEIGNPWNIQVFVDRDNAEPGQGVTIDECARVSRYVEGFLDVDDAVWPNYTLEVSSPGVERKLTKPRHYELSIGRDVRIVVHRPIEKQNVFKGTLVGFEDGQPSVECEGDGVVSIEWDNIAKSRLIYDFSE